MRPTATPAQARDGYARIGKSFPRCVLRTDPQGRRIAHGVAALQMFAHQTCGSFAIAPHECGDNFEMLLVARSRVELRDGPLRATCRLTQRCDQRLAENGVARKLGQPRMKRQVMLTPELGIFQSLARPGIARIDRSPMGTRCRAGLDFSCSV